MSATEPVDDAYEDLPEDEEDEFEEWDAYWDEVERKKAAELGGPTTRIIRGVEVQVPHDLPLMFERTLDKVKGADDFKGLVAALFGADALDAWIANGMKEEEFRVVFAWGYANGKGIPTSFRKAHEMAQAQQARSGSGKETGSARTSSGSGGTGSSSKPTSRGSTASRRKTSPH
ncbi:hypothetical protein ACIBKY_26745 [Nonomuraea sp. NPDC050394]|uniref:hypothetical protein n=1 Tax=Nonomuraea sp. NPDC050394 TaxID=3364363 RepID=UPI00379C3CF5